MVTMRPSSSPRAGHVAEGATCNIFVVRKGKLITPPASDNILEGIARECVMELARRELKLEVVERSIDRSELYVSDEMFFTGTAVELGPVIKVDHRPIGNGQIGGGNQRTAAALCGRHPRSHGRVPQMGGPGVSP